MKTWNVFPLLMIVGGTIVTGLTMFLSGLSGAPLVGLCLGTAFPLFGIPFLREDSNPAVAELESQKEELAKERAEFEKQRAGIEQWRDEIQDELNQQVNRIESKERSLAERLAAHQELFELPNPNQPQIAFEKNEKLTHQDQQVLELLQREAEVAYEKIREKAYSDDNGKVDLKVIRDDMYSLIQRVARIYNPDSDNPLLETSFENVARAAGRICLHTLVLVEQLPLDVKQYNFNSLYAYIRKAVVAYGHYQKSSPWLTHLSRSVYAGRFLAGANPLTLGAWVVATEVGKRAGQKAIENFVDRQAIGLLHDLIRVVGFEVANIYGGDFRHRDPNWIYGSELTELVGRFPMSRESLREGLRQVSGLPLRNEYDRVYLYRCIADHRAAGLTLSDPALLTREEREQIAAGLETFFASFIHGATERDVEKWQSDFEERFDMRLQLKTSTGTEAIDRTFDSVRSIHSFLESVVGLTGDDLGTALRTSDLFHQLDATAQEQLLSTSADGFTPPDFDPTESAVDDYLNDLIQTAIASTTPDENIERLLCETGAYFRRPIPEMQDRIDAAFIDRVTKSFVENAPTRKIPVSLARILHSHPDTATFAYPDVYCLSDGRRIDIENTWLVGMIGSEQNVLAFQADRTNEPIWRANKPTVTRDKGFLIDDCQLSNGDWQTNAFAPKTVLAVAGTIRGGGYTRYFGPLLDQCNQK